MTEAKNVDFRYIFYLRSLLQRAVMVAKKLLVVDKINPCVKQICLLGVISKVSKRKTLPGETFCFLAINI